MSLLFTAPHTLESGSTDLRNFLEMIERRAPLLMRIGGGALIGESLNNCQPVPPEMKAKFEAMIREGRLMDEIAQITGYHYGTVVKHTRAVRTEVGYGRRSRKGAA